MRPLSTMIAALSLLLAIGVSANASAWDWQSKPSASAIKDLLRAHLEGRDDSRRSFWRYPRAEIRDFDLITLEEVSPTRWHAKVELLMDFGPAPASVVGFKPVRRGVFTLLLESGEGELRLLRFSPNGRIIPLPAI